MRNTLMKRLQVVQSETDMLDAGGVFALMGPTGAGKTTTTAKLAARFVVRHGAEKLALLTTDSYRIGGHEQLRIYGKILGVTVHAVRDAADLRLALSELRNKHTVLIDTVGMSQRDQAVAEQVEMLCQAGKQIKRLLLLNATSHGDTLDEVVQAYQTRGLDGCILSKIDEAASLGPALDCAIRHQLIRALSGDRPARARRPASGQSPVPHSSRLQDPHACPRHGSWTTANWGSRSPAFKPCSVKARCPLR